jgi:hypothetical protein
MRARFISLALPLVVMLLAAATTLGAQAGSGTDILTGSVRGPAGEPVAGVSIRFTSVETGVMRATISNQQGRFTMVFPGGGGRYEVEAMFLGMSSLRRTIARLGDEEVLIVNLQMDVAPIALEGVDVTARRTPGTAQREPGNQERSLSGEALNRLPVDATDLNSLASLVPGVVGLDGGDTLGLALSIMGQGPMANQVTLDGTSFGGGEFDGGLGVPQEAVRMTRVITNTYDVSRGQFSGGQISTTTRSGTNNVQGSFSWLLRDPSLQWAQDEGPFGGEFRQNRISGGIGGPILRDRLFYFGSFSFQRRSEGLQSLISADAAALQRLGASPDTVARFLSLLGERGVYAPGVPVPSQRIGDGLNLLGRMDYNLSERHTVTLRGDAQLAQQDPFRVGALGLPQTGGVVESSGGGAMLSLTSRFGNGWINELRAYGSLSQRETMPYAELPAGRVRVASDLEDGTRSVSTLVFGSGTSSGSSDSRTVELTNELSLLIGTRHRVRLGGVFNSSASTQEAVNNRFGTYTFNSLAALEEGRAASFTRALTTRERESGGVNAALYAGDTWRPLDRLQLTYGARLEGSAVASQPAYNPAVEAVFGHRTDAIPGELRVSPRVGFSYNLRPAPDGGPRGVIRGGFGEFRARPAFSLFGAAQDATGLPDAQSQLYCVGAAVPFPDWEAFRQSAANIPSTCAGDAAELPTSGRGNNVTVFDSDFAAARSWRGSLGFQRRVLQFLSISMDANYAVGVSQQGTRDLNLNTQPAFTLPQEGNRPVFVAPGAIVASTGQVPFLASRLHPEFGQVYQMHSELSSRTGQLAMSLNGFLPPLRMFMQGSYTYTRSSDEGSSAGGFGGRWGGGFGGSASLSSTVSNPNEPEWATSDFERRHSFSGTVGRQIRPWVDVTLIGRATAGNPFSPLVGGDINGDGARNDRAFIFDPATTADPALAAGMATVLQTVPDRVRECLVSQLGQLAERNSCMAPWRYSLDMRANFRPELPGIGRRLTVSVDAANTLTGLDRLLHGSAGLRGWGQSARPDNVLLYPRGFDEQTQSFRYEVNERFGVSRDGASALRNPFQLQIQARMAVGRVQQQGGMMGGMGGRGGGRGAGGGGGGAWGGGAGGMDPSAMIDRLIVNPVQGILSMSDTLQLTPEQVERLRVVSDTLQNYQAQLADSVRAQIASVTAGGNPAALMQTITPRLQESRARVTEALREAEEILTPEQWERVPEELRTVRQIQRGGQRGTQPRGPR